MNIKRILIFLFKKLWGGLTEPFESLTQTGYYRRAVTSSAFLLFACIAIMLERLADNNMTNSVLVLLIVGYILSRTHWFRIAALILISALTFPAYLEILRLPNPDTNQVISAFGWVVIPLLLSSLIYSLQVTIAISILNFLALTLISFIRPALGIQVTGGALEFYGVVAAILIIVMIQRDQIDQDRQKKLLISQDKLIQEILERERFAEHAQRRADELVTLNEVSMAISSLMELDNIFNFIYEQIKHHFQLDVFFITLYDEKTGKLSFPLTVDNGKLWHEPERELSKSKRVAQVIRTGEPLLWNRTALEIQEAMRSDNRVGDPSQVAASILINPLQVGKRIIGVISVQSYKVDAYTKEHLILLSALAHQIVIAIENARLFEETKQKAQQLSILNEIGQAISALKDLPELLEVVFQQAQQYLNIDTFYVGLYDPKKEEVVYPIMYDDGQRYDSKPDKLSDGSYLYKLLLGEKAKLINRTMEELAILPTSSGMLGNTSKLSASLMIVPLALGNRVIGVFSAQSYTMNAYNESDLNLFIRIANQVSIAIENSRLYTAAQEEIAERKKIEEQLRAPDAKDRDLVERVPAVIYSSESGATGHWFYVSPQIESLLGFTPQEWIADPNLWYQQIHPDDREYTIATEEKMLTQGSKLVTEYRIFAKNGRLLWIRDESTNVSISDNQLFVVQGLLTDITIRKQAESTLKESEEKYHSLFITAERQARELTLLGEVQSALASELDLSILIHNVVEASAKTFG